MRLPQRYNSGRPPLPPPPATGLLPVDSAIAQTFRQLNEDRADFGVMVRPQDNLRGLLALVDVGETVVLLPGEHFLTGDLVISRRVTLLGFGRVRVRLSDALVSITGADVWVRGIEFVRDTRNVGVPVVEIEGDRGSIDNCLFDSPSSYGVQVAGDYCAVRGCRFLTNAAHVAGDADVYWNDGATYGIVAGNSWSTTRQYVLSYLTGTNMSQAANGPGPPPGIVFERP